MRRKLFGGTTGATEPVFVAANNVTNGSGLSGLAYNTAGLVCEYRRQGQSAWTAVTLSAGTLGSGSGSATTGTIVADGADDGSYEVGVPDNVLAAGAKWAVFRLRGAAGMVPVRVFYEIDAVNYQDAASLGLSRLDAAVTTRLASGGYTAPDNTGIAAIQAKTDNLSSDPADASDIAASFSTVNTTLGTIAGYLDTEVAAIKAKTDNLPAIPAAVGSAMTVSGTVNATLVSTGLDSIVVETGVNVRQALSPILAAAAGVLSGAGSGTIVIKGGNVATTRITAETDDDGNRTSVALSLPA